MFEKALEEIKRHDTIIIQRHRNPDGDAMGSQVGLYHIIRENYPEKTVYMIGEESKRYFFIPGRPMDDIPDETFKGALAIILDTPEVQLLDDNRFVEADSLRFDHHIFVKQFCDVEIIDRTCESCAGLVTDFAMECGLRVSSKAATALFTGIVTDSGRFRYDSTTSATFRRAAFLLETNIDTEWIYRQLYETSFENLRKRATFTTRIRTTEHNVAYIYSTRKDCEELGVTAFEATRAYVSTMADIKGVKIWAAFAEDKDEILVEIRSSCCNINPIAVKYGGGGHAKASGTSVPDREIAMKVLRDLDRMAASE